MDDRPNKTNTATFSNSSGVERTRPKQFTKIYNARAKLLLLTGAIIGDGGRKRAPFLVLGLSP